VPSISIWMHTDPYRYARELRSRCNQPIPIDSYARAPILFLHPHTAGRPVRPAEIVLEGSIPLDKLLAAAHRHQVAAAA